MKSPALRSFFRHAHFTYFRKAIFVPIIFLLLAVLLLPFPARGWQLKYAPLMTDWAQLVDTNAPLPEYPRPQMVRPDWLNLNGVWQFQPGATNQPAPTNQTLNDEILVPFPMESALSGVAQYSVHSWYRRTFTVPTAWNGQRILLHLDAVDWESEVFINGQSLGVHQGGYDPITYDITTQLTGSGPQELIVRVYDPTDARGIPRGKQTLYPGGIMYTSCSGIWQPVWIEPVPNTSIAGLRLTPDLTTQKLRVTANVAGPTSGVTVYATARSNNVVVSNISGAPNSELLLPVPNPNLWSPTNPFLYDLSITLSNGATRVDSVASYFGMRKISSVTTNGFRKMLLNNQFVFEFGPLDQGFWPDGIYTAPTDDALKSDIEQIKLFGFNMLRKHIKVERARWYYWADKLGILVWQDMPSLNSYTGSPQPVETNQFRLELTRMVTNHWNHPSIISWVVFNEGQGQHDTPSLVSLVETLDPSRLVNQASGNDHFGVGSILDWHSYPNPSCPASSSQSVVCGEFGGVGLGITNHTWASGWGYVAATNGDDLAAKFEDFCFQLSDFVQNQGLSAAVYTEITDVETELNGFLTYDRKVRKPDADRIRAAIASASAPATLTVVVPTSQTTAQTWKYTTTNPTSDWITPGFNDSAWSSGPGGFGAGNPPNTAGILRTPWNTGDIWLRRTFNPGPLTSQQISNLFLMVYNDEDVEIYVNGVLAGSATGYRTSYGLMSLTAAGRAALIPNAINTLAVHCHQTSGGQYIDVGLVVRDGVVTVPALPTPAKPTDLRAASGTLGVSLGWSTAPNATTYKVKRSLTSGGPYSNQVFATPLNAGTDTNAAVGTTYYYVVSAVNASGESADSSEISITVPVPVPPSPIVWLKADAITGVANGAAVASWPDTTGNGFNATQNTSARRPTFITSAINGLPIVRFNAANSTYLGLARPVEDDFTIICVYRASQGVGTGTAFYQGAGLVNGEVANTVNDFGLSLNNNGRLLAGTGNPDITIASTNTIYTNGLPHIVIFRRTRATGELTLHVDGIQQGTATAGKQSLTTPPQLVLGAQQTLNNYLTGDIAEVKIYAAALNATDRAAEEATLRCKYGLGSGGVSPVPSVPTAFTVTPADRRADLNWFPVVGATGYKVQWSTSPGGPFTQLIGNLTAPSYAHTNPILGQTNYYRIAAYSSCGTGNYSAAAGVYLSLPSLSWSVTGTSLNLHWPDWAANWQLYSATNLTPPITWMPVTNSIIGSNGEFTVNLPFRFGAEYFRLTTQ